MFVPNQQRYSSSRRQSRSRVVVELAVRNLEEVGQLAKKKLNCLPVNSMGIRSLIRPTSCSRVSGL
jgi:hypothetical protein